MARDLKLEVILSAIDRATRPFQSIMKSSGKLAKTLKATKDQVKALNNTQRDITGYRKSNIEIQKQARALKLLQGSLKNNTSLLENQREAHVKLKANLKTASSEYNKLAKALINGTGKTAEFQQEMARAQVRLKNAQAEFTRSQSKIKIYADRVKHATQQVSSLTTQQANSQERLAAYKRRLDESGVSTDNLSAKSKKLRQEQDKLNDSIKKQQEALQAANQTRERMSAARNRYGQTQQAASNMAMTGMNGLYAARGMGYALYDPIQEGKQFVLEENRIAALGLGDKATQDAIKFAKAMQTYGTSATENITLVRDAMSIFADEHHAEMVAPTLAKMKFVNHAMYGEAEGQENERKFMDMLKVIELRGGLASTAEFERQANIIQKILTATGGRVGPNEWLNVIKTGGVAAKGQTDDAFYNIMEPLVQEMGGHRVGTAMMSAYSNIYQGRTTKRAANNLQKLGLVDESKVKHDKVGQISFLDVGAIKGSKLFAENQFAWMEQILLPALKAKGITDKQKILDTIGSIFSNRTASNLFAQMYLQREQIHKNASLNRGADGISELYAKAPETAQGKELDLLAKKADAYKQISDSILPYYLKLLEAITSVIQKVSAWIAENPELAATITKVALAITVLVGVFALLTIGMSAIIGPFALLRYGMALFGLSTGVALGPVLAIIAGIALLAAGAYLVWKNWDTIGPKFSALWESIKEYAKSTFSWFESLPSRFADFGANIVQGLINGLKNSMGSLGTAIKNMGAQTVNWFKEKLGIHSPSRVFATLGGYTMQGLDQGLAYGQAGPLNTITSLAKRITQEGESMVGVAGTGVRPALSLDTRPPIMTPSATPQRSVVVQGDTIKLEIHAGSGTSTNDLKREISRLLDERDRKKASRMRSALYDPK